jgi:hypothetical protein
MGVRFFISTARPRISVEAMRLPLPQKLQLARLPRRVVRLPSYTLKSIQPILSQRPAFRVCALEFRSQSVSSLEVL